jgi:pantothenate kinase-related protein Tda10
MIERNVSDLHYQDFLENVPADVLNRIMDKMTPMQRSKFPWVMRAVPMGVLILLGPGGSGKSTMLGSIVLLLIAGGEKIAIVAPTDVATTNILMRTAQQDEDHRLLIRVWASRVEEEAIMRYDPSDPNAWLRFEKSHFSGHESWEPNQQLNG